MVRKTTPPVQTEVIDIAALRLNYPGPIEEGNVPDASVRIPLNATCRALTGIDAIVQILYANEIERQGQDDEAAALDRKTLYGLFDALSSLAEHGGNTAREVGSAIFAAEKGGV